MSVLKQGLAPGLMLLTLVTMLSGCAMYAVAPVPAPRAEFVPVPPRVGAVWIRGHWAWRPRARIYVWVPGYYRF